MQLQNVARSVLSTTAVAWGIPLAQAEDSCRKTRSRASRTFQSLRDRAYLGRVASDCAITAKVKAALLREPNVDSLDVSVETYKGGVLLSGFVKDEAQRWKAAQVAAAVSGVTSVKDGMAVR